MGLFVQNCVYCIVDKPGPRSQSILETSAHFRCVQSCLLWEKSDSYQCSEINDHNEPDKFVVEFGIYP